MRRRLVAGNWKMNGNLAFNAALLAEIKDGVVQIDCDLVICAPAPYLAQCQSELEGSRIAWGGQDISMYESGAYTGEVSASMLLDFGCRYVILGHSERRAHHGETSDLIAKKIVRALSAGLTPIVCVGETLKEHDSGHAIEIVGQQIEGSLALVRAEDLAKIVVAYEPVWAVGTGQNATPEMAQEVHTSLRAELAARNPAAAAGIRILYGGSVKPDNARNILLMPDVDGCLIGGAALKATDFLAICGAATDGKQI